MDLPFPHITTIIIFGKLFDIHFLKHYVYQMHFHFILSGDYSRLLTTVEHSAAIL
jgi:hypothetical protein